MRVESSAGGESPNELKAMVAENMKLTKDLAFSIKKIRRYMFWLQLTSWLKFILIAIPLVLAAVYLQPMINNLMQTYNQVLEIGDTVGSVKNGSGGANIENLLNSPQVQEILKKTVK